jgi:phosphinothricin acetyltransferase
VDNPRRQAWITQTALGTALNVSYMAERLSFFSIVIGIALLLTGIGFLVVSAGRRAAAGGGRTPRARARRGGLSAGAAAAAMRAAARRCATLARVVRDGLPADGEACAAIYAPSVRGSAISFEDVAPSAEEMSARIERTWRTHPWLVDERDGAVAGYAYAAPHHPRAAYRWAANVAVYVAEGNRRSGVGRDLYERLFELLRAQGVHVACAGVTLPNAASVALHESLGFEPVGVLRRIGWKAGAWRDVGWWQLALLPQDGGPPPEPAGPARPAAR